MAFLHMLIYDDIHIETTKNIYFNRNCVSTSERESNKKILLHLILIAKKHMAFLHTYI
jgi:hypothetical protein